MRRREKPPVRVWTSADLPAHLAVFDPLEWGALPSDWHADVEPARRRWHLERSAWLRDHDVNVLEELLARRRRRREAMRQTR